MSELRGGPLLAKPSNLKETAFLNAIDKLCENNHLKPSDRLFWGAALTLSSLDPVYSDKQQTLQFSYLFAFDALDNINGSENPDTKSKRPLQLSENSLYRRLKTYQDVGLLEKISHKIPIAKQKTSILKLKLPSIQTLQQPEKISDKPISQAELHLARKQEITLAQESSHADLVSTSGLEGMGSLQLIARYLSRCIRPDDSIDKKTTLTTFPVKGQETDGRLSIVTTCLDTSSLMTSDDLLLADICYQMIQESLKRDNNRGALQYPIKNRFRFDKAALLREYKRNMRADSGEARRLLDQQLDRIFSTSFEIEADQAEQLMRHFNFIAPNGNVYDRKRFSLLSVAGEEFDETEAQSDLFPDELQKLMANRKSSRYVTVSLPDFMEDQINDWLQQKSQYMMSMFGRDLHLLEQKKSGVVWVLNNYLRSFLINENSIMRRMSLHQFINNWFKYLDEEAEIRRIQKMLFSLLTDESNMLHYTDLKINSRKDIRLTTLYSKVSDFLFYVENITPEMSQLSKIKYDIHIVRLTDIDSYNVALMIGTDLDSNKIEWLQSLFTK